MSKNKKKYNYWREIQRTQLGISSNMYSVFSSGILAYSINILINQKDSLDNCIVVFISISIVFLISSLVFYSLFTHNRLKDFRKTAQLINNRKSNKETSYLTQEDGEKTWNYYNVQRYLLFIGFVFALIGYSIIIYS